MTNKCFSAHCTNDALENGVLCKEHYENLPAPMRGEQAPSKELAELHQWLIDKANDSDPYDAQMFTKAMNIVGDRLTHEPSSEWPQGMKHAVGPFEFGPLLDGPTHEQFKALFDNLDAGICNEQTVLDWLAEVGYARAAQLPAIESMPLCSRTALREFIAKYWPDLELRDRASPPPVPEWQPIETAPKDETLVLLWWPHWSSKPCIGYFDGAVWCSDCRLSADGGDPLAWMPLPSGPTKPVEPAEPTYECINEECGWVGLKGETVRPKHDADSLRCPECHEVVELDKP